MRKKRVLFGLILICLVVLILEMAFLHKAGKEKETEKVVQEEIEAATKEIEVETRIPEQSTENVHQTEPETEEILSGMTLREKICQMLFVNPEELTGVEQVVAAGDTTREALKEYPVGGIMYSKPNMQEKGQLKEMIANTQLYSKIPLFTAADEEGGIVNRLMDTVGTTYIDSMYNYKDAGVETAYGNAEIIANDMKALGFNLDFAPVADVWSNPDNTVIGERAYSDDYGQAAELVAGAVTGFHAGGVLCTLKHFPGHGDTSEDSHYSSAYVRKTREELEQEEFLPFKAGIEAGADFVMVGHLTVPDIDEQPATFSETIIREILREELGFDGIIITDSLAMSAVAENYTSGEIAVKAIKAGNDMLLEPQNLSETVTAVESAVNSGEIEEERINESVRRILKVKDEW